MDLAELGFSVDSKGFVRAEGAMDRMTASAKRTESATDKAAKRAEAMGKMLARTAVVGAAAMAAISAKSIKLAIDAEEVASKFQVVFRGSVERANERLVELTKTIPLTVTEMRGLSAGIQDMLVPMGVARKEATDLSLGFIELAGDISAFNNVETDVVLQNIQSALAGSSEPMRKFGIDTRESALQAIALSEGLIEAGEEMTTAARAQAVFLAVQKDSADAAGYSAAEMDSLAGQMRIMSRDFKQAQEDLGKGLIPAFSELLRTLNEVDEDGFTPLQRTMLAISTVIIRSTQVVLLAVAGWMQLSTTIENTLTMLKNINGGQIAKLLASAMGGPMAVGQAAAEVIAEQASSQEAASVAMRETVMANTAAMEASLERMHKAIEALGGTLVSMEDGFDRSLAESEDFTEGMEDAAESIKKFEMQINDLSSGVMQELADNFEYLDGVVAFDEMKKALGELERELDPIGAHLADIAADMEMLDEAEAMGFDPDKLELFRDRLMEIREELEGTVSAVSKLGEGMMAFGGIAAGALSDIQQGVARGSEEYRNLEVAISAANLVAAIGAVLNQANGDPYTAFARMAAMVAAVASLGQSIGGISGGFTDTAAERQATQGTGTVLGDAEAKSESISKAIEMTADATSELVGINRGMLTALETLNAAITGATGALARGGANSDYSALPKVFESNAIFDPLGLFGGKAKISDEGVAILSGSLSELIDGTLFRAYQEVQSKKYIWSSTKTREEMAGVGDAAATQFGLIFQSLADAVTEGAKILGISQDVIDERLAAFRVAEQRISLKDLSAEEQQAEIEAVISSIFDDLAVAVVPYIEQFQKVGEGLGETLVRVATSVQVMEEAIFQLGFAADAADPEQFAQMSVALVELTGGVSEFISKFTNFVNKFATDEHKLAIATDALNRGFAQVGLTVPATAEGFWDLMQSLDATTAEGQAQIAMLLDLTDFAADYYDMMDDAERTRLAALDAEIDAMVEIQTIAEGVVDKLTGLREMIVGDLSSPEENYERLRAEAEELAASLQTMTDPAQIEATVARIEALTRQAYSLLDEEQQQAMGQEFLDFIDAVQATALERLNAAADNLLANSNFSPAELLQGFQERVADPLIYVGAVLTDAANLLNMAAGNFYIANGGEGPLPTTTPDEPPMGPVTPYIPGIQSAVQEGMRAGTEAIVEAAAAIIQSSSASGASAQEVAAAVRSLPGRIELRVEQSEYS